MLYSNELWTKGSDGRITPVLQHQMFVLLHHLAQLSNKIPRSCDVILHAWFFAKSTICHKTPRGTIEKQLLHLHTVIHNAYPYFAAFNANKCAKCTKRSKANLICVINEHCCFMLHICFWAGWSYRHIHLYVYKKVAKWMNMAVFYSSNVESTIIILVVLDILIYIGYVP